MSGDIKCWGKADEGQLGDSVTPTSGLSQGEVDRLVEEGDKFRESDELRRDQRNGLVRAFIEIELGFDGLTLADEQIRPNVVVLGNAAHGLHPVAGQGFNVGLRDAWDLKRVSAGTPREAIGARATKLGD